MRNLILIYLIVFSSVFIYAQDINTDSRLLAFKNSIEDETNGNYSDAISEMLNIAEKYKNDYLVNIRLGWLYYLNSDFSTSVSYYQRALQLSGENNIEAMLGITLPLSEKNNWDEVKDYYQKIIDIDENNYTANLRLGQILLNTANYLNAKSYLSKVHENYPGDYESTLYLGWTLYYLGDKSSARKLFIETLALNPDDESALKGIELTK